MREIILDTETTGLNASSGDRIVEIGCIELLNQVPTGNFFHTYVNPERDMPEEAFAIHGLSTEFLLDKPKLVDTIAENGHKRYLAEHESRIRLKGVTEWIKNL